MPAPAKMPVVEPAPPPVVDLRPDYLREPWGLEVFCEEIGRPETRTVLSEIAPRAAQGFALPAPGDFVFSGTGPPRRVLTVVFDQPRRVVAVQVPRVAGDPEPA